MKTPRSRRPLVLGGRCNRGHVLTEANVYERIERRDGGAVGTIRIRCKTCAKASTNRYHQKDGPKQRSKAWLRANSEYVNLLNALSRYGVTLDQYHSIYEGQDFACPICRSDSKPLFIDHDHGTLVVRGLLCDNCNRGLGLFGDDAEAVGRAALYMEAA